MMDAKTLLEKYKNPARHSGRGHLVLDEQDLPAICAALELAAAVEGPEEATPWADSIISCIGEADSETCDEIRQLERQRNAALIALRDERERHAQSQVDLRVQLMEMRDKYLAALAAQGDRHD